jgi:hypothetical protein
MQPATPTFRAEKDSRGAKAPCDVAEDLFPVYEPFLAAVRALDGRPILAVKLAIAIPLRGPICPFDSGPVLAMEVSVDVRRKECPWHPVSH